MDREDNLEKKVHLSFLESKLASLIEENGLSVSDDNLSSIPESPETDERWYFQIPVNYKEEKVFLFFSVDFYKARTYSIFGGIEGESESEFKELKQIHTENLTEALNKFELYLTFGLNNEIPPEFLPLREEWEETITHKNIPNEEAPEGYEKIPVYEVIREFVFRHEKEEIKVQRSFANWEEFLRIFYEGATHKENLTIKNSKITYASTLLVQKLYTMPPCGELMDMNEDEFMDEFAKFFDHSDATPKVITYHNITRFEKELKELPWQDDMEAIYIGNGIFEKIE